MNTNGQGNKHGDGQVAEKRGEGDGEALEVDAENGRGGGIVDKKLTILRTYIVKKPFFGRCLQVFVTEKTKNNKFDSPAIGI